MNEVEYILRIVLKARDELAGALKKAREELRLFANAADSNKGKIDAFNKSIETMDKNVTNITDKMREWRAVMQGTAGDNEDSRKSFGTLGKEIDSTAKTTTRALKTQADYTNQSRKLRQELRDLEKAHKDEAVTTEYARSQYQRLGRELETLSGKITANTERSRRAFSWSQQAKKFADDIIAEQKRITADAKKQADERVKAAEDELARKRRAHADALRDLQQSVDAEIKAEREGRRITSQIAREEERDRNRGIAARAAAAAEAVRIAENEAREQQRIRDRDVAAQRLAARAATVTERVSGRSARKVDIADISELRAVRSEMTKLAGSFESGSDASRHFNTETERVRRTLRTVERDAGRTTHVFGELAKAFRGNGDSLATLDNQFRGVGVLAMVGFAQQLITVLGGLAGGFVAVAGSAAQAGAAIGGAFVAGIGQALPSIGLLTGALMRVSAVMDVVKQAQLTQKQEAVQAAGANRRVADATDSVRTAQEGLANSQRQVRDAQEGLTKARQDAREELEDLVKSERDAELAARGAVLSQEEAQEALRQAVAGGDTESIARANLDVLEAQADAEDKLAEAQKARAAAAKGARGGVEGTEGVQQAKRALEDAERSAAKASRGIETAKRNANEAAAGTQTAAATLNYLLAQLSPAERRLYQALTNIQEAYKKTYRPITDLIIDSFTRSVEGVQRIMLMPEVIRMARTTAQEIAQQLNRIFDAFTSDKMIAQFLRIAEAGRKNLAPLVDIAISVGKALANIAETAGPALSKMLDFIGDLADDFLKLTSHKGAMEDFFNTGEKHFEAWVKLGLAVIELFAALSGAGGAQTGFNLVNDATKAIDGLTEKVKDNRDKVKDFFEDSRGIIHEVIGVVVALAEELFGAFTPERVHNFATLLKEVIIPALGDVVEILGHATQKLVEFADTPVGGQILKGLAAFAILSRVFTGILGLAKLVTGVVTPFVKVFAELAYSAAGSEASIGKIALQFGKFAGIVGIVVGVIALLDALDLLDDAWDAVVAGAEAFWKEVQPAVEDLVENFKDLWDAVSNGEGIIGPIGDVLRPVLKVLIDIGEIFMTVFGRALGRIFGGAINILSGFFKILEAIILLDPGKLWDGLKTLFGGLIKMVTATFRILPELFWEGLKRLAPLVWNVIKAAGRLIGRLPGMVWEVAKDVASWFGRGFRRVGQIVRNVINDVWDWLKRLPSRFWNLAKNITERFGDGIGDLGSFLKRSIEKVWDWLKDLPKRLGNIAKDAVKAFANAFKDLGKLVGDAITGTARGGASFAKNIVNSIFTWIEKAWDDAIGGTSIGAGPLKFTVPQINLPQLAKGGPIPGFGTGDKYPALLEAGEHVLTRQEVAAMGGHGAVFALRRALGGGGQGTGGRYREGGKADGADAGSLSIAFHGGELDDFVSQWRRFWVLMASAARRGTNLVEAYFRDMRQETGRQMTRMYRQVEEGLTDIQGRFKRRGAIIVDSWSDMWTSLKKVTFEGLDYIGHETNKALKGLGEKHINFGLEEPKKSDGKAGGGWIGTKGQRGRDRGLYSLGAGEAVLNWQHQKYVEPAMNAYYGHGLTDMFNRTRGYHAGGPGQATGFAAGGFSPIPGYPGEEAATRLIPLLVKLIKQYSLIPTDVYDRDHSAGHASPGHNVTGTALDAVPKVPDEAGWNRVEALGRWAVAQGMTVGYGPGVPGSEAWSGHGRGNHIHIELGSNTGPAAVELADYKVKKPKVKPADNPLGEFVQAAIDKVLKAANAMLTESIPETTGGATNFKLGDGSPAHKVFEFFTARGLSDAIAAGFVGTFQKESNFVTTVENLQGSGATGLAQWLGGRLTALKAKPNWQSLQTQLNFVWEELHGPESAAFAAIKRASTPEEAAIIIDSQYERSDGLLSAPANARAAYNRFHHSGKRPEFAKGGEVPGGAGEPVSIIAHAHEWVLNIKQQAQIARMLGMSRQALKGVLGFGGRATRSFAEGGEILHIGDSLTVGMKAALAKMFKDIKIIGTQSIASDAAFEKLKQNWKKAYREVIFDIGTNDAHAGTLKKNLKKAHRLLGEDQDMIVSTVSGTNAKAKNEVIREFARQHSENVRLVKAGSMRGPDGGIHLDPAGYQKRAELFATNIREGRKAEEEGKTEKKTGFEGYTTEALRKRIDDISKGVFALPVLPIESWKKVMKEANRAFRAIRAKGDDLGSDIKSLQALTNEGGIIDAIDAARERFTNRLARSLTRATYKFHRASQRVTQRMDDVDVATRELENTRKDFQKILGEEGVITKALKKTRRRLRQLRRGGVKEDEADEVGQLEGVAADLRERRRTIRDAHAEALARIFEAQVAKHSAIVDEINSRYEREAGGQDIFRRIGTALGDEGIIAKVNNAQRDMLTRQADELEKRIGKARRAGATDLAIQLEQQVADLRTQIFESIQQELRDTMERINARASKRLSRIDLGGRMLDAVGAVGLDSVANVAGEQFTRGGLFARRGEALQQQRTDLQGLLGQAEAQRNVGLIEELTEQLAELDVTIQENTRAAFTARIEDSNARFGFSLNINDLNKQIIDLEGTIAGQVDQAAVLASLQERGNILASQRIELEGLLLEAQAAGDQQAVNDLTIALLENRIAILGNTQAVEEATGLAKDPQTFTSSAWTWFREAVFNGMGAVLPQYDMANMGASAMTGIVTGAVVYPPITSSTSNSETNITLNEVGRPVDLTEVSSVVTFASKTVQ